jgi:hypothetical protein
MKGDGGGRDGKVRQCEPAGGSRVVPVRGRDSVRLEEIGLVARLSTLLQLLSQDYLLTI